MITLEAKIDAGTDIKDAFTESIRIATVLKCVIEFNFNGVTCWGFPDGDYVRGCSEYSKAIASKDQYKFAHS